MKRKILFSLAVTASLFAGNITISKGWNLVGAPNNINQTEFTSNNCIKSVWKYDSSKENGPWFLYNRDGLGSSYPKITNGILKGEGFWVLSDCVNDSNISYMDSNTTDLQKTFNSIIVTSGSQMATVGKTGGSGVSGVSSTISNSTKDLGKVLFKETQPPFSIDENGRLTGEINITGTSNTALFKITFSSLNGQDINASYLTDFTGKAYGLDDDSGLPKVGPDLATFFYKLSNGTATQNDFVTIITEVNNMKTRPLFSIVGDDAFQNFFASFPYDETSAQNANWQQLGQKLVDLNLSEDNPPDINFSKINYDMNMSLDHDFNMGGMTLTLPYMVAHGSLDTLLDPNKIQVNFSSGDRNGSFSIPAIGVNGQLSNIEINCTVQIQTDDISAADILANGKYDMALTSGDGHTYTGFADFGEMGCLDAYMYDENGNFAYAVERDEDALWIIDAYNQKIKKVDQTTIPTN